MPYCHNWLIFRSPNIWAGDADVLGPTPELVIEGEYVSKGVQPLAPRMLPRESAGIPTNAAVVFDPVPLPNWLFAALNTSALSLAGDMTIEGKLNPAVLPLAGATQVVSKLRKNCSPFPAVGQSSSVNTPNPGVSVVFTSTLTFLEVKFTIPHAD